jgi:chemotaxis protein methyltransferase CheR
MPTSDQPEDPRVFWDRFYGDSDDAWSGRVNARLVEVASDLVSGRALDLGCGEGADAVWLAEQGWQVTAVDISANALQRAAAAADERGVGSQIAFERHDLPDSFPDGRYDLVSAQFLHAPVHLDRDGALCRAAEAVSAGGVLLIVDHAAAPPWAKDFDDHHEFPAPDEVIEGLRLDAERWQRVRAEACDRETIGPDEKPATVTDNVIVMRRTR